MDITKRRWVALLFCCLANLCLGSVYTWSVFAGPMAAHISAVGGISLTAADLSIVYTLANSVSPLTMICGGWFNDRFGPKKILFASGLVYGCGIVGAGFATDTLTLALSYGLMGGLGIGMGYGCVIGSCVKMFPDKRGLVGGVTTAAFGMSSVILPPVVTAIIEEMSVVSAFHIVGCVFALVICACSFFLVKCPADFVPEGWTPPAPELNRGGNDMTWKEMLRTPVFFVMMAMLMCGAFSGMMVMSQASSIAQESIGMSVASASLAVSVIALFNAAGRLAAGFLSDRIGRVTTLSLACVAAMAGTTVLYFCGTGSSALFTWASRWWVCASGRSWACFRASPRMSSECVTTV